MKLKIIIIAIIAMASISSHAQSISYDYDDAGNRIARKTIGVKRLVELLPLNATVKFNTSNQEVNITEPEVYNDLLAEKQIKIYPNPTRGKLALEIVNYNLDDNGSIQIFDIGGRLIKNVTNLKNWLEIDITNQPPGSYIMIIVIGNEKSEWKVIKQ